MFFHNLSRIKCCVFPLNAEEDQQLQNLKIELEKRKKHKLSCLTKNQRRSQQPIEQPKEKFKNLSSQKLDPKLVDVLNRGPSFVNAQPRKIGRQCLEARASLQVAVERLKTQEIPEHAVSELKGGLMRVINECENSGPEILKAKKISYKRPPSDVVITHTDKSKRLVALDSHEYLNMINASTIGTGNYEEKKRLNLPRTEQIRFNKELNQIINKYKIRKPELYRNLKSLICSEPLPSPVHCLPKDHKEGELKGRPIHSATDTPSTHLSKFLVKALTPLLSHVHAHLRNTEDFLNFLNEVEKEEIHGMCSLDVKNLYGSIPLEDVSEDTLGVFTAVTNFFEEHQSETCLSGLELRDFEKLLRLSITTDTILINDKGYSQKNGLAMGNNLAPMLAIIYMHKLDQLIIEKSEGAVSLKRYIDDIFAVLHSDRINADKLLEIANSLNQAIKFTLEMPNNNNELPFLDTLVTLDQTSTQFKTELYIKPIHSQSITPWDSHGPISSKRALIIGETKRAVRCSTDRQSRNRSLSKITKMFISNGYPKRFVRSVIRRTIHSTGQKDEENPNMIYLKLPYINEQLKRRAVAVIRRSGISSIRTCFMSGYSLSRVLAPPRDKLKCKNDCETCKMTERTDSCLAKSVIYRISCLHCNCVYVGETGRTVGSRIKEHLTMSKQTVYTHLLTHDVNPREGIHITWEILHYNIPNFNERKVIEALEIQKNTKCQLMNGCIGRLIDV